MTDKKKRELERAIAKIAKGTTQKAGNHSKLTTDNDGVISCASLPKKQYPKEVLTAGGHKPQRRIEDWFPN